MNEVNKIRRITVKEFNSKRFKDQGYVNIDHYISTPGGNFWAREKDGLKKSISKWGLSSPYYDYIFVLWPKSIFTELKENKAHQQFNYEGDLSNNSDSSLMDEFSKNDLEDEVDKEIEYKRKKVEQEELKEQEEQDILEGRRRQEELDDSKHQKDLQLAEAQRIKEREDWDILYLAMFKEEISEDY